MVALRSSYQSTIKKMQSLGHALKSFWFCQYFTIYVLLISIIIIYLMFYYNFLLPMSHCAFENSALQAKLFHLLIDMNSSITRTLLFHTLVILVKRSNLCLIRIVGLANVDIFRCMGKSLLGSWGEEAKIRARWTLGPSCLHCTFQSTLTTRIFFFRLYLTLPGASEVI